MFNRPREWLNSRRDTVSLFATESMAKGYHTLKCYLLSSIANNKATGTDSKRHKALRQKQYDEMDIVGIVILQHGAI